MNTLPSLASEYDNWRKTKKKRSDRIPEELLNKAREAAKEFGFSAVQRAIKVTPSQLERGKQGRSKLKATHPRDKRVKEQALSYTVLEVPVPRSHCIELVLPGEVLVRSHDVRVCLEIIEALTCKKREQQL